MLRFTALRTLGRELIGCAILAGVSAIVACTSITGSSTASSLAVTTYAPITGIAVDANDLFSRIGCGHGPGIAFKYIVVVNQVLPGLPPVAMSVNDCFADAVFENLANAALGASDTFNLTIFAFDDVTYDANTTGIDGGGATSSCCALGAPVQQCAGAADASDPCPCCDAFASIAKWTTTCTVKQQPEVESVAACGPLAATGN